jgi:hypothetical protein
MTAINVDADNPSYSSTDGVLLNKNRTVLFVYPRAKAGNYAIPAGITEIRNSVFFECAGLTGVTIPASVTRIGGHAFYGCSRLTSVTIPASVRVIFYGAFKDCTGLTAINVDADNPSYSSTDGVLFNKGKTELIQCPGRKTENYEIPAGVTRIGQDAFYKCTDLTSVTIPTSVTHIGQDAFYGCTGLTSVTIPTNVTSIAYGAFQNCTNLPAAIQNRAPGRLSYQERLQRRQALLEQHSVTNGNSRRLSYQEKMKRRRALAEQHGVTNGTPVGGNVREQLQQDQMDSVRQGKPPLPISLTPEMDAQLVKEGVLPPQEKQGEGSEPANQEIKPVK